MSLEDLIHSLPPQPLSKSCEFDLHLCFRASYSVSDLEVDFPANRDTLSSFEGRAAPSPFATLLGTSPQTCDSRFHLRRANPAETLSRTKTILETVNFIQISPQAHRSSWSDPRSTPSRPLFAAALSTRSTTNTTHVISERSRHDASPVQKELPAASADEEVVLRGNNISDRGTTATHLHHGPDYEDHEC